MKYMFEVAIFIQYYHQSYVIACNCMMYYYSIDNLKRSVDSSVAELSQKEKSVLNTVMER